MYMSISGGGGDQSGLPNHYEVLGVDEEATESDIKRAYVRLVRTHRPQENPEDFQRFNDASKTLTDPRRRGAYDQTRRNGRRVQVLVDQAAKAQDSDPQKAIALLKNAIALAPDVPRPRLLLAQVLIRIDEYGAAEKQYRWLIKDNPHDETLYFKMARSMMLQDRYNDAEVAVRQALSINERYHDALMLLSRLRERQGAFSEAAELLERAIANDNKENYADSEALLRLLVLALTTEDHESVERVGRRLLAVVPTGDTELAVKLVQRMLQRVNEFYQAENFPNAERLLDYAVQAAPEDEELSAQIQGIQKAIALRGEARQIQADNLVRGALKTYLELRYLEKTPDSVRQKLDVLLARLQGEIAAQPRELCVLVEYLRREYPAISGEQERLLGELYDRAARRLATEGVRRDQNVAMPETDAPAAEPESEERSAGGQQRKGLFGWLRGGQK